MARQSFIRHAVIYGLGTVALHAAGFFLLPLYTKCLTPQEYGTLEVLNRIGDVVVITLLFGGARQALLTFYGQNDDLVKRQQVVGSLILLVAFTVLVGMAAIWILAEPLSIGLEFGSPRLLRLAVAAMFMESSMMVFLAISQAREESTVYVSVTVGQFISRALVIIYLVAVCGWGIEGILTATLVVSGSCAVGLAIRELARGAWPPDWALLRGMMSFALPLVPGSLGFFLMNNGDRFFLRIWADPEVLGTYALGYKLALAVNLFGRAPFTMVWGARMYEKARQPDAAIIFGQFFTRLLAFYLFIGLGLSIFQDEVIAVLGGIRYGAAAETIAPVVLGYFFLNAADLMDSGFYVQRRTIHKTWIVLCSTTVMLAFYWYLIPSLGGLGAALATLAGFAFHSMLTYVVSQRVFPVRYEPGRVLTILSLSVALWCISRTLPTALWTLPCKAALWLFWPLSLWICGSISRDEKYAIASLTGQGMAVVRSRVLGRTLREMR